MESESAKHWNATHGASHERLYYAWRNMRNRCRYACADRTGDYKGRGIKVCDEWVTSYENFRDWAMANGYADDLTLDRADNSGDYSPENCRWVTMLEQGNNKRNNVVIEAWGETKTLAEWVRDQRCLVAYGTLWTRLRRGMAPELAMTDSLNLTGRKRGD